MGHARYGRIVTLPADYVRTATELGYASTVHTAQGVTADTLHGVVTGEESRQQLYTMLSRGRSANHVYLSMVGNGDPHTVLQPDTVHPRTATELLEQILARDASPQSATTLKRERQDPAAQLGAAAARDLDALHLAAEHLAGPQVVVGLDQNADHLDTGLTAEPAWPTLRAHLLLLAAAGADPVAELLVTYYEVLLEAGVRIYQYPKPTILHAKHFTVDDMVGIIGSSNMDYRSFGLDYEITLMSTGKQFVADLQRSLMGTERFATS